MKRLDPGPFVLPMPTVLVGADIGGKPNFMTAAFAAVVSVKPPTLVCGLNPAHRTCEGIVANQAFSVCVPSVDMVEAVDWCGIASGHKEDKSGVFEIFRGEVLGVPMARECPLSVECKLVQVVPQGLDSLYIAEIVGVYAKEECLTEDKVDWGKLSPLLFTFSDLSYWKLGPYVGKPWQIGRGYRDKK